MRGSPEQTRDPAGRERVSQTVVSEEEGRPIGNVPGNPDRVRRLSEERFRKY